MASAGASKVLTNEHFMAYSKTRREEISSMDFFANWQQKEISTYIMQEWMQMPIEEKLLYTLNDLPDSLVSPPKAPAIPTSLSNIAPALRADREAPQPDSEPKSKTETSSNYAEYIEPGGPDSSDSENLSAAQGVSEIDINYNDWVKIKTKSSKYDGYTAQVKREVKTHPGYFRLHVYSIKGGTVIVKQTNVLISNLVRLPLQEIDEAVLKFATKHGNRTRNVRQVAQKSDSDSDESDEEEDQEFNIRLKPPPKKMKTGATSDENILNERQRDYSTGPEVSKKMQSAFYAVWEKLPLLRENYDIFEPTSASGKPNGSVSNKSDSIIENQTRRIWSYSLDKLPSSLSHIPHTDAIEIEM